ncbi:hypothetical protein BKA62DRAFT_368114 [Auriculariales sp. MPI-PUGE-AT-0066]|nr:hypothetical protein BKA62DRAFT_368114 [Auriculariales sp. MPI-PUGE-AT-0066]
MSLTEDLLYIVLTHLTRGEKVRLCAISSNVYEAITRTIYRDINLCSIASILSFHASTIENASERTYRLLQLVESFRCVCYRNIVDFRIAAIVQALPNIITLDIGSASDRSQSEGAETIGHAISSRTKLLHLALKSVNTITLEQLKSSTSSNLQSFQIGDNMNYIRRATNWIITLLPTIRALIIPDFVMWGIISRVIDSTAGPFPNVHFLAACDGDDQQHSVGTDLVRVFPGLRALSMEYQRDQMGQMEHIHRMLPHLRYLHVLPHQVRREFVSTDHKITRVAFQGSRSFGGGPRADFASEHLRSFASPSVRSVKTCVEVKPLNSGLEILGTSFLGLVNLDLSLRQHRTGAKLVELFTIDLAATLPESLISLVVRWTNEYGQYELPISVQAMHTFVQGSPIGQNGAMLRVLRVQCIQPQHGWRVAWRIDRNGETAILHAIDWDLGDIIVAKFAPELRRYDENYLGAPPWIRLDE